MLHNHFGLPYIFSPSLLPSSPLFSSCLSSPLIICLLPSAPPRPFPPLFSLHSAPRPASPLFFPPLISSHLSSPLLSSLLFSPLLLSPPLHSSLLSASLLS